MIKIFIFFLFFTLSKSVLAFDSSKPITIISGFSSGATDQALRPYVEAFEKHGYKVVIEHKPGANGIVALNYFSNNVKPDGYTLFATASSMFTLAPLVSPEILNKYYKKLYHYYKNYNLFFLYQNKYHRTYPEKTYLFVFLLAFLEQF